MVRAWCLSGQSQAVETYFLDILRDVATVWTEARDAILLHLGTGAPAETEVLQTQESTNPWGNEAEQPTTEQTAQPMAERSARYPSQPAVFNRWCNTWSIVRPQVAMGHPLKKISKWLKDVKQTKISTKTLGAIVRAGEAGLLNRPLQ